MAADVNVEPEGLTIDELAVRTGTTTRTLRLYQTKSLLPPPRIVGRIGYYSDVHVNRLIIIDRLQKRGFSLAGIAELFKVWQEGKSLEELLGLEAKVAAPWNQERPERLSPEEFKTRFPLIVENPDLLERLKRLRVVREDAKGYVVPTPLLFNFGVELYRQGMPVDAGVAELEFLNEDVHRIAKRFMRMFRKHLLSTMVKDEPKKWLSSLAEWSEHNRSSVLDLVMSAFTRAMDEEIEGFQTRGSASEVQSSSENDLDPGEDDQAEPEAAETSTISGAERR